MRKSFWLISAGAVALATPAFAQDTSSPTGEGTPLEESASVSDADYDPTQEIIVTAQGRQQALQDVPLAVTAVTAESLQNSGASDIRQLNQLAPSLLVSSTGSEANGSARVRGIGTVGDNPGLESSVAVFIDGVYRSRTGAGLNELGEIERVEVLRGPQGTLFGRNASAGLINIVSKKPSFDTEGYGELTYGNFDYMRLSTGVTGPIAEGLAARFDGVYVKRDGFLTDVESGDDVNDRNRVFARGQLLYDPGPDFELRLIGDYTYRNEACCGAVYTETRGTAPDGSGGFDYTATNPIRDILVRLGESFPAEGDPYSRDISVTPGRTFKNATRDWGLSAQADIDLGLGTLTSITAYREYKAGGAADIDYGAADIAYRAADGNNYRQFKTLSQELRLQGSAFDDRLDWLVGAYYADEKLNLLDNTRFGTDYGAFASCRIASGAGLPVAILDPTAPGCLSPTARGALSAQLAPLGPVVGPSILAGLDRLSTVNDVGDVRAEYMQDSRNYAFFTHNIISVTDALSLTLGARYTNEKKDFEANFNNNNTICPVQQASLGPVLQAVATNPAIPAATRATLTQLMGGIITLTCQGNSSSLLNGLDLSDERKEDQLTGTAVLSYEITPDLLAYASYSKGYKAGGFNLDRSALGSDPGANAALTPRTNADVEDLQFAAEKVDAFEIGAKFSSRGFTFNVAGFRQEFKDFQLNTFNGSVFIVQTVNGCGTDLGGADTDNNGATGACASDDLKPGVISQGVELEAAYYGIDDIALTAGYTYADTHYRENLVGSDGEPLDNFLFLLPGSNLSNSPKHVGTASFSYTPDLGGGLSGLFYVDGRISSGYNTGSDLFPEKYQDSFEVINARIGVRGPDESWSIEAWAQNLLNEDYQQVAFNSPFQGANSRAQVEAFGVAGTQLFSSYLAEPRTYGVTLRGRF